ncbi:hypothetical protein Ga0074812_14615 [Parafrankia irregularis]|uniref:Fibronectin type-III domain-containing protein n=1 Tax=Parafrankia irregularis TaxID=795642 RepID=A0A0S4QYL4_9ACTN|nr:MULTISPECIES: hypothetical protein [Parafrankia]MBE3205341.1 zinc ribbon domain-containing protein [Parafrankia sp. CH37]CUU60736.1 hypothetical protein Ga0074812_14615 [Parafrankia irregularis]
MSAAFDGSGYRRRVLAALRARTPVDTADPFLIADLDPRREHTDSEVAAQLARVVAFLQRERNSAKYAALATELVRRRGEWETPLLDGDLRIRLQARVLDARRSGDAERLAKLDGYLVTLRDRFGGIPASRIAGLRRLATAAGVSDPEFDARLAREKVLPDGDQGGAAPLAPEVRSQIRQRLEDLRVLRGGDLVGTASLWDFLGVAPDAGPQRIRAAWESVAAGNARRPHDREKTLTADLLAMVRSRLIESDPAPYTAGLSADVADELRPAVEEHVVLDGELTAVAYEGLVRAALAAGRGLGTEQVKSVIIGIARDLGAAVSTGGAVDYVLCPGCGRPEPVGGSTTCRYCDTQLYTDCPACGSLTEAAAVTCRRCGYSLRQVRAAGDALTVVRQALEDGRPRAARDGLSRVRAALAAAGPAAGNSAAQAADELDSLVRAALAATEAGWRALAEERATLRPDAAVERARWLVARAADVPGPDGRLPAEVLGELTAEQAVIRRRVEAARALSSDQQEAALVAVLATAADSHDALAALAALPLQPPTDLTSVLADDAVLLRWRPSASAGPVSYRVERIVVDPGSGQVDRRALGTTGATELADSGAPAWRTVRHEVTALSGERQSRPVSTAPLIAVRDIADLRAEATPTGVRLTWRPSGPADTVTIERMVDPESTVTTPPRRARVTGSSFLDPDVLPGVGYHYRAFVEYVDVDGNAARTAGAQAEFGVVTRPRPVTDLLAGAEHDQIALRWTARTGAQVRVYAVAVPVDAAAGAAGVIGVSGGIGVSGVPGVGPTIAGVGSGPLALLGPEGTEVPLAELLPPLRLVGASRHGQLRDAAVQRDHGASELIYVPVTVVGEIGIIGRSVRHRLAAPPVGPPAAPAPPMSPMSPMSPLSPIDHSSGRVASPPIGRAPLPAVSPGTQPVVIDVTPAPTPTPTAPASPMPVQAPVPVPVAPVPPMPVPSPATALIEPRRSAPSGVPGIPHPAEPLMASARVDADLAGVAPATGAYRVPAGPPTVGMPGPATAGMPGPATVGMPGPATAGMPGPATVGMPGPETVGMPGPATVDMPVTEISGAGGDAGPQQARPGATPPEWRPDVAAAAAAAPPPSQPTGQVVIPDLNGLTSVSYSVAKAGWRRRTLRVQVRSTGPVPRLVLVARPGEEPPTTPAEGQVLAELQAASDAGSWTMEVTLEGAQLPWGIRLLPVVTPDGPALWVDHPEDVQLVIR